MVTFWRRDILFLCHDILFHTFWYHDVHFDVMVHFVTSWCTCPCFLTSWVTLLMSFKYFPYCMRSWRIFYAFYVMVTYFQRATHLLLDWLVATMYMHMFIPSFNIWTWSLLCLLCYGLINKGELSWYSCPQPDLNNALVVDGHQRDCTETMLEILKMVTGKEIWPN